MLNTIARGKSLLKLNSSSISRRRSFQTQGRSERGARLSATSITSYKPSTSVPTRNLFKYSLKDLHENERETMLYVPETKKVSKREKSGDTLRKPLAGLEEALAGQNKDGHKAPTQTKITKLSNGITVASEDTYAQITAMGLYARIGSRFESEQELGYSQLIERLVFRGTEKNTHQNVIHTLEHMGANVSSASHRDMLVLSGEILRELVDPFLALMSDTILIPKITTEEVQEQAKYILEDFEASQTSPHVLLTNVLHQVAYGEGPLSRSAPPASLIETTSDDIYRYIRNNFVGPRLLISAASADHDELVSMVSKHFSAIPSQPVDSDYPPNPLVTDVGVPLTRTYKAQYYGGMQAIPQYENEDGTIDESHVIVAFEGIGLEDPDVHVMYALQTLMGGGASFSAGGPGKGINSRLFTGVLNRYGWVRGCEAFTHAYGDTSLFGIHGECNAKNTSHMLDVVCDQLAKMAANLTEVEVARARNQLKTRIFYNLETRAVVYDDIARYILAFGKRYTPEDLCDKIDLITVDSMKQFASKLISSNPCVLVHAPEKSLQRLPEYESIVKYFNKAKKY